MKNLYLSISCRIKRFKKYNNRLLNTYPVTVKNMKYTLSTLPNKLYFSSKNNMNKITPINKRLFLSPYIGISSIFVVDADEILRDMMTEKLGVPVSKYSGNVGYDEWHTTDKKIINRPLKMVHINHNYILLREIVKTGISKGFIYVIDTADVIDNIELFVTNDPDREVIYIGNKTLTPTDIIPHTIEWSIRFDMNNVKKHGIGRFA